MHSTPARSHFARLIVVATVVFGFTVFGSGPSRGAGPDESVSLGAAAGFGVLAAATATNTGSSVITGEAGVSPGSAVTGFPPGRVVAPATIHHSDALADQAHADAATAYQDAAGRIPAVGHTALAQLGSVTFSPGVYSGGALALTGTVVLDAQHDPDAVFIFQAASTLILAAGGKVSLINGAQACHVFWQVGSSATLGTDSSLSGTVLALASVTATTGASVNGRLLALNGAVTLDTNAVTVPSCLSAADPLTLANGPPPAGLVGSAYTDQLMVTGGTAPITWSVSSGALPAGVTLDAVTGLLSGVPTTPGTSNFVVTVTDSLDQTASQALSILVLQPTSVSVIASASSVTTTEQVTLAATVTPGTLSGAVSFTDVSASGSTVLGTAVVGPGGQAAITVTLPAFGGHSITAAYGGDSTHAAATSALVVVQVHASAGDVIVTQFRQSGPAGAADEYVDLYNARSTPVALTGFRIVSASGAAFTLPAGSPTLAAGRSYLVTGAGYSLGAVGHSDIGGADLGSGGIRVVAPDTAATVTDAVGPDTAGFFLGSPLPTMAGTPTDPYAWVRTETSGRPTNTSNSLADFALVSSAGGAVGGATSMRGSASPTGLTDPYQHNSTLQSTLLDPTTGSAVSPNRVVVAGSPRKLVVRRTITNSSGAAVTAVKVRITALSEANGLPLTGATPPAARADLRVVNPTSGGTSQVPVAGRGTVTVRDLSVDAPITAPSGGGLNSTLTVPLPGGQLAAGGSIDVAFTFEIDSSGTFWFGYDVDGSGG